LASEHVNGLWSMLSDDEHHNVLGRDERILDFHGRTSWTRKLRLGNVHARKRLRIVAGDRRTELLWSRAGGAIVYGFRGLGQDADDGSDSSGTSTVVGPPDLTSGGGSQTCPTGYYLSAGSGCLPLTTPTTLAQCQAMYSDPTMCSASQFSSSPFSSTAAFSAWVTANSTLLIVSFSAIGLLLTLVGKKR